jgi:hypothetical protein
VIPVVDRLVLFTSLVVVYRETSIKYADADVFTN